ncbi:MAG: class I SAM-dependent methyltransferase [Deltaproteobacteria bacterium]|nr:class I SAM-dependent methyltransferase [Deltaproteobacteria bacterium]
MTARKFDDFAEDYDDIHVKNLGVFGGEAEAFTAYKMDYLRELAPTVAGPVLEFGCGVGRNLPYLAEAYPGAALVGADVSGESLKAAVRLCPACEFRLLSTPADLAARGPEFDLIFVSNVFHHIPPPEAPAWVGALRAVCRPGARLVVFEHNPLNLLTRLIVARCPFDEDAVLLQPARLMGLVEEGGFQVRRARYTLVFPWRTKLLHKIEKVLGMLPLGCQYYVLAQAD